jgi:NADPH2:quinone reductase
MKAIRVAGTGGPEALKLETLAVPRPVRGELLVRIEAAGVNFIEIYQRKGQYPMALPYTPGSEGAGTVVAVGEDVDPTRIGERIVSSAMRGTYAEYAIVPAEKAVRIPDGVTTRVAAALILQGITAHYLATSTYPLTSGTWCLVHAAAGGVGLLLCQIARMRGASVIGTVSNARKAGLATDAGARAVIITGNTAFPAEVRRLTGGRGVDVVYDSVGADTFAGSLDSLTPRGMMALYGQSSGPVPPFDPQQLNAKGSLFLTRPTITHYIATREELVARTTDLFDWVAKGALNVRVHAEYPLADAERAHRDLESRSTAGKLLLIP